MKQLSLLVLAGLTTGCFAADQAQPKAACLEFIALLRNPAYRAELNETYPAGTDILTIPGYAACAQEYDRVQRLANNKNVNYTDHEILDEIHLRLAKRLNRSYHSPAAISFEEAIAREDALKAGLKEVEAHLHLLSEKMELPDDLK